MDMKVNGRSTMVSHSTFYVAVVLCRRPGCRHAEVIGLVEVPTRINKGKGAMAQYIAVEVSVSRLAYGTASSIVPQAARLVPKPSVPWDQSAGLPTVGMTAHQGLFEHGKLKAGDRVMINGGSSSVGAIAIQLAKDCGATVVTSCSGPKKDMVKGFGADEVGKRDLSVQMIVIDPACYRSLTTRLLPSASSWRNFRPSTSSLTPLAHSPFMTPRPLSSNRPDNTCQSPSTHMA